MGRWVGSLLLHTVVFLLTWMVMVRFLVVTFSWITKAGGQLPPDLAAKHFLILAFIAGLIAGLIGYAFLRYSLLLIRAPEQAFRISATGWKAPQTWVFVLFSFYFLWEFAEWILSHSNRSVLATSASINPTAALAMFFGEACEFRPMSGWRDLPSEGCLNQVLYTMPWIAALGYSVAGFIPRDGISKLRTDRTPFVPEGPLAQSDEEKTPE